MEYHVISADGHIDMGWLPRDLFTSHAPDKWKDQAPRIVDKHWWAEGRDLTLLRRGGVASLEPPNPEESQRIQRMYQAGFYDGRPHPTTPELRIHDQDLDGVHAEVIYGIIFLNDFIKDPELLGWIYQTYNTWLADFCKTNPSRLIGIACLPNHDPEVAAAETRRVAKIGLKGVDLVAGTAVKPIWHRDWDVLWAAVEECGIPVSFHTSGLSVRGPTDQAMAKEYALHLRATAISVFQLSGAEFLASIVFSGALERFPRMKFVLGECGASWIPYVIYRMDEEYEDRFRSLIPMKPSEYWSRQGYTTFQHEKIIADFIHRIGEHNVMWGSDYPHPDGVWPDSRKVIAEDLGHMDERIRRRLTYENAAKLYGLM